MAVVKLHGVKRVALMRFLAMPDSMQQKRAALHAAAELTQRSLHGRVNESEKARGLRCQVIALSYTVHFLEANLD